LEGREEEEVEEVRVEVEGSIAIAKV